MADVIRCSYATLCMHMQQQHSRRYCQETTASTYDTLLEALATAGQLRKIKREVAYAVKQTVHKKALIGQRPQLHTRRVTLVLCNDATDEEIEAYLSERAEQLLAVAPAHVEYKGTVGSVYTIPATNNTNRSSRSSNSGDDDEESDAPSNGNANGDAGVALRPGATKGPSKNSRFQYPTAKAIAKSKTYYAKYAPDYLISRRMITDLSAATMLRTRVLHEYIVDLVQRHPGYMHEFKANGTCATVNFDEV
eukprot:15824-Heterococcus_DN1.PRE.2